MTRAGGLLRSFGPECQRCGCPMALALAGMNGARPWAVFRCEFCGNEQGMGRTPPPGGGASSRVTYKTERCKCPNCGAKNPPVMSTQGSVRWHKCQKCHKTFQSVEE